MFVTMRMLGKEVELVRFPGESHELSRSGAPAHRRQRAEIILEFFGRHLAP
jgi:dipeptidyl aminopeptidase/acylaminoacyl peptidase